MDSDQFADDVQPDQGQGDGGSGAPYEEYLSRFPEEYRDEAASAFKDWDANTTRKFQEHSEYRKSWEPYEQLGVNQIPPDQLSQAVQLYQTAVNDPQQFWQWSQSYAQEAGLTPAEQQQLEQQQQGQEFYQDPETAQLLQQQLQEAISPLSKQLEQLTAWQQQQEQQMRYAEAEQYVRGQLDELKQKHGDEFNEQWVERLVTQYIDTDPQNAVQLAWADYQTLRGQIEKSAFEAKAKAPAPAETGGVADGSLPPVKTLEEANKLALEQIRASLHG